MRGCVQVLEILDSSNTTGLDTGNDPGRIQVVHDSRQGSGAELSELSQFNIFPSDVGQKGCRVVGIDGPQSKVE